MKSALNIQIKQRQNLAPQLQKSLRLLQLTAAELAMEIQTMVNENPMLSIENDEEDSTLDNDEQVANIEAREHLDFSSQTSSNYSPSESMDFNPLLELRSKSLHEHLLWQLDLTHLDEISQRIASIIIDSVSDAGYLIDDLNSLQRYLLIENLTVSIEQIEQVLIIIQAFDPIGVASRTIEECLLNQLDAIDNHALGWNAAKLIINDHLSDLAKGDVATIKRSLKTTDDKLQAGIALVKSLNPKPGLKFFNQLTETVTPDVEVIKENGEWQTNYLKNSLPKVGINSYYQALLKNSVDKDNNFLRYQLRDAKWFLQCLETRQHTICKIVNVLLEKQIDFFEFGSRRLKPLTLDEVAKITDMHESTISRAIAGKYLSCSHGIFKFKYFFSSELQTEAGVNCSSTAVTEKIKQIIKDEPNNKPLSDNKIAFLLKNEGINIARRTVTKYRESLGILPSSYRKEL